MYDVHNAAVFTDTFDRGVTRATDYKTSWCYDVIISRRTDQSRAINLLERWREIVIAMHRSERAGEGPTVKARDRSGLRFTVRFDFTAAFDERGKPSRIRYNYNINNYNDNNNQ